MKLTTLQLDMEKREDCQLVCDLVVYPHGFNSDTCTYFLEHKKVRTQEKIEFVESMRNSKLGIYEIKEKLSSEGLVKLRNVLSNETVTIVDQGMSMSNTNNESQYLLLRIIETSDLCFQSGLIFVFQKKTLTKWLKKHKGNEILFNDVLDLYYLKENDRFLVKES